ncbi:TetR family transcriptional regulator [Streptomyces sp. MN03-5084-2B]|nr:TetR family transcriptional regulator [Streptomyces sp. MN03-5084-2B]
MTVSRDVRTGLRELKKRQTRQAISDAATRLFLERGFENVTITEVAAAAGVSKMTVSNYFPRKEDLALDHHETFAAALAHTVATRPTGESALAALRRECLAAIERHDPLAGFRGQDFTRMITDSLTLTTRLRDLHDQREEALARVLATDTARSPRDIAPAAAAALLGTVHRILFHRVMDLILKGRSNQGITTAVLGSAHHVFGLLEPSLGTYAVR